MYHILFIHSFADGHLGCFHVQAIIHIAAVNIGVCVSIWIMVFSGDGYRVSMLQDENVPDSVVQQCEYI